MVISCIGSKSSFLIYITTFDFCQKKNKKKHGSDQLEKYLSMPRIERLEGRAIGYWDNDCNAVCIRRKDGKFDQFGYSCKGQYYLTYYEALFLLELVRFHLIITDYC